MNIRTFFSQKIISTPLLLLCAVAVIYSGVKLETPKKTEAAEMKDYDQCGAMIVTKFKALGNSGWMVTGYANSINCIQNKGTFSGFNVNTSASYEGFPAQFRNSEGVVVNTNQQDYDSLIHAYSYLVDNTNRTPGSSQQSGSLSASVSLSPTAGFSQEDFTLSTPSNSYYLNPGSSDVFDKDGNMSSIILRRMGEGRYTMSAHSTYTGLYTCNNGKMYTISVDVPGAINRYTDGTIGLFNTSDPSGDGIPYRMSQVSVVIPDGFCDSEPFLPPPTIPPVTPPPTEPVITITTPTETAGVCNTPVSIDTFDVSGQKTFAGNLVDGVIDYVSVPSDVSLAWVAQNAKDCTLNTIPSVTDGPVSGYVLSDFSTPLVSYTLTCHPLEVNKLLCGPESKTVTLISVPNNFPGPSKVTASSSSCIPPVPNYSFITLNWSAPDLTKLAVKKMFQGYRVTVTTNDDIFGPQVSSLWSGSSLTNSSSTLSYDFYNPGKTIKVGSQPYNSYTQPNIPPKTQIDATVESVYCDRPKFDEINGDYLSCAGTEYVSPVSAKATLTAPLLACDQAGYAPTGLKAVRRLCADYKEIDFSWDAFANAVSYDLYSTDDPNNPIAKGIPETKYILKNNLTGGTYYIKAITGSSVTGASSEVSVTSVSADLCSCKEPTSIRKPLTWSAYVFGGDGSISYQWKDESGEILGTSATFVQSYFPSDRYYNYIVSISDAVSTQDIKCNGVYVTASPPVSINIDATPAVVNLNTPTSVVVTWAANNFDSTDACYMKMGNTNEQVLTLAEKTAKSKTDTAVSFNDSTESKNYTIRCEREGKSYSASVRVVPNCQ
jgi:hypothetical protein